MSTATVALLAAGVGASSALAGTVVTAWASRSSEAAKWRRDRRAETYVELLDHLWAIRELAAPPLIKLAGSPPPGPGLTEREAQELVVRVVAFGSRRMVELRDRFTSAAMKALFEDDNVKTADRSRPAGDTQWARARAERNTARQEVHTTLAAIEELIRHELQPEPLRRIVGRRIFRLWARLVMPLHTAVLAVGENAARAITAPPRGSDRRDRRSQG
jgi:hypothetical protein